MELPHLGFINSRWESCALAFLAMVLVLVPRASAQAPPDPAWTILQSGSINKTVEQRVATMRVLQLIPGNAKAVAMAELALKDKEPDVRSAAALTLGAIGAKTSIPALFAAVKTDKEGAVVMAEAKALIELGDEGGYSVYYALLTGQLKSGSNLIESQQEELHELLSDPKKMQNMAFQQGIGFVPYGGIGLEAFTMIHNSEEQDPILKATSIKILARDPDPRTEKAILAMISDKHPLVRAAAYDAMALRGDPTILADLTSGLTDENQEVKMTAAAAAIHLSDVAKTAK